MYPPPSSDQLSKQYGTPDLHLENASPPRYISRTPSPTPSETEILTKRGLGGIDFKNFRKYLSLKYLAYWIIGIILVSITILTVAFHNQIVNWLRPIGDKIKALPAGWLIPVALLVVMSFPPLFGHEFVAIICGVVWGLGIGFAIVALGTILGELANFFAFRLCCRARGEKLEKTNLRYGLLSAVVRQGGFRVAVMARLSAIPPHFTTLIFSVTGMNVFVFLAAAIISLPRQFSTVYFGVLAANNSGQTSKGQRIASGVVIAGTIIITILAMRYMNRKIDEAKPAFLRSRQKARQYLADEAGVTNPGGPYVSGERIGHRLAPSQEHLIAPTPQMPQIPLYHQSPYQQQYNPPPNIPPSRFNRGVSPRA